MISQHTRSSLSLIPQSSRGRSVRLLNHIASVRHAHSFARGAAVVVRYILAVLLLVVMLSPAATIAQDEDDEEWIIRNCPAACRTYIYESWEWYAFCWPLPRKCSANPVETMQARTSESLLAQILDILRSGKR